MSPIAGPIRRAINKAARIVKGKITGNLLEFRMETKEQREAQVQRDFDLAKIEKEPVQQRFKMLNNYYNGKPYTQQQAAMFTEKFGINFHPPSLPDAYVQVESQIDDVVPTPQFKGRDDDMDGEKAKVREQVVNFVWYNNDIDELNINNDRSLNELGNAIFKVAWDGSIQGPGYVGDIVIGNPDPANIFPDPAAYDVDDCEYFDFPYRLHRRKARRQFGEIVNKIMTDSNHYETEIYDNQTPSLDDETLQVLEHWYRDDEGDIACSIQINNVEVKHIPKYWVNTRHSGNKMYPFVHYTKIPVRKSFWGKGEIDSIKDLLDAGNREFITALLNDVFMANDIVVVEEGAMVDEEAVFPNHPGAEVRVKQNKINAIRRLGGLSQNGGILSMIQFISDKIQEANGNYDSSQGKEPVRVTTSSGIAQLNEKAEARKSTKKAGRTQGFKRLAQLTDWTALEFYNTDRIILIRGKKPNEPDTAITFNSETMKTAGPDGQQYYPTVDVEISVGEGIKRSKAFTLAATQELANLKITPENVGIVLSIVDLLDLPNSDDIKASIEQAVAMQQQMTAMQSAPGAATGQPGASQAPGAAPAVDVEAIISQLSPEEQEAFFAASEQEQELMLQKLIEGGAA
ncbi:hypothetical protein [Cohnella sp. GCM10012308]|uniref:portal protein n=1 Tax=Cohnella sp. GCM10012308 TaxID=3317329 RepID=UPI0036167BA3